RDARPARAAQHRDGGGARRELRRGAAREPGAAQHHRLSRHGREAGGGHGGQAGRPRASSRPMSSDPPSAPRPSSRPPVPPPMNALAATGWALGAMVFFYALALALVHLRPGSENDVVSGVGCQAIAYLAVLFLILRIHAPDAGIRHYVGARPTHWAFYLLAVLLGVALEAPANALYDLAERVMSDHVKDRLPE